MQNAEIMRTASTGRPAGVRQVMNHLVGQRSPNSTSGPRCSSPENPLAGVALAAVTLKYSDEIIRFKRLVKDIGGAGHNRPLGMVSRGQYYYRDIRQHRVGVALCEKLVTVHHRHHEVEQYQARRI